MKGEDALAQDEKFLMKKLRSSLKKSDPSDEGMGNLPQAAVCAILKPDSSSAKLSVLLLKRKERPDDPWSGHMAFPGGKRTDQDQDIFSTALREVMEETGIDIRRCEVLGTLKEAIPSNLRSIRVLPFVVLADEAMEVRPNPGEIERFFWIPISFLRNENNVTSYSVSRLGVKAPVPCYVFAENCIIWGLTFRIIQDLVGRIGSMTRKYRAQRG